MTSSPFRWLWIAPCLIVAIHGLLDTVHTDQLIIAVNQFTLIPFFESQWTYVYLHLFSFLPVFLLSFDKKVHYYKQWKFLIPGILIISTFFILWDIWFTDLGVWGFNNKYHLDFTIGYLPIEEWLFFITIPFCCVFIYECVGAYLSFTFWQRYQQKITMSLILILSLALLFSWGHLYTITTFGLAIGLLLIQFFYGKENIGGQFYLTYLISCLPFLMVNGVLTGSVTTQPVVMYNPDEYFGLRLGTIPLDDMVYSFLLLMSNILFYEYVKKYWKKSQKKLAKREKKSYITNP